MTAPVIITGPANYEKVRRTWRDYVGGTGAFGGRIKVTLTSWDRFMAPCAIRQIERIADIVFYRRYAGQ